MNKVIEQRKQHTPMLPTSPFSYRSPRLKDSLLLCYQHRQKIDFIAYGTMGQIDENKDYQAEANKPSASVV